MGNMRIDIPQKQVVDLCRRHHVRRLSLFGSVTHDDFSPQSDVDVLVEFEEGNGPSLAGLVHLQDELSGIFGQRPVNVATPSILRNPYRRKAILKNLTPIYGV
jgi:hypothetical protein